MVCHFVGLEPMKLVGGHVSLSLQFVMKVKWSDTLWVTLVRLQLMTNVV